MEAFESTAEFRYTTRGLKTTELYPVRVGPVEHYDGRGRPARHTPADPITDQLEGALASALSLRQARLIQHSCFVLARNDLNQDALPPQEWLDAYKGQSVAERGFD